MWSVNETKSIKKQFLTMTWILFKCVFMNEWREWVSVSGPHHTQIHFRSIRVSPPTIASQINRSISWSLELTEPRWWCHYLFWRDLLKRKKRINKVLLDGFASPRRTKLIKSESHSPTRRPEIEVSTLINIHSLASTTMMTIREVM